MDTNNFLESFRKYDAQKQESVVDVLIDRDKIYK